MTPNRVLITGVSNPLGAEVARRLAPKVSLLFGCDIADPISALEEMDFVQMTKEGSNLLPDWHPSE